MHKAHPLARNYAPGRMGDEPVVDAIAVTLAWAAGLSEMTVRSMASDYLRGDKDPCNKDAFDEYERRYGPYEKGLPKPEKLSKSARARKRRNQSKRA